MPQTRPTPDALPIRLLSVTGARRLTPRMRRVTLGGDALAGFSLGGPDQQVKLF